MDLLEDVLAGVDAGDSFDVRDDLALCEVDEEFDVSADADMWGEQVHLWATTY